MKHLLVFFLTILYLSSFAQREPRFIDSLTLDHHRAWIELDGSSFTSEGENCNYGMEMTFFKDGNKVEVLQCVKGEWKKSEYLFEVVTKSGEHYVAFYEKKKYLLFFSKVEEVDDFRIEIQMISDSQNNFITELNYYGFNSKTTRTLKSKKN